MVAPSEQKTNAQPSQRSAPAGRILIADDDAAIRTILVELLRGEGYEVLEAKSGNEVLRIVPVEEPDLLLMDLRMPEQDGIQIMRRLATQDLPVNNIIMMTAFGTSSASSCRASWRAPNRTRRPSVSASWAIRPRCSRCTS